MSEVGDVFDQLAQDLIPFVAATAFPDLLTIYRQTETTSTGGGVIFGDPTAVYEDVPCHAKALKNDTRGTVGGQLTSREEYEISFPTHDAMQSRIAFDVKTDWFILAERGNEPTKKYRPIALQDVSGVLNRCICIREDDE